MSHWANYIKEREGMETLENEFGFITYTFTTDGNIFIRDMFIDTTVRNAGKGQELFSQFCEIAARGKAKKIVCQVDVRARNATHSLGVILSRGFQVVVADAGLITLIREVSYGGSC